MNTLLRVTGIRKLISFYGYIYFNQPELTRLAGIGLILVIGLTHMYEFPEHFEYATYIGLSFAALFVGTLLSAVNIIRGKKVWGWTFGAVICVVAIVGYVISRTWGLPGIVEEYVGLWAYPAGSFAVLFELSYLALWFTVVTGANVAAPETRDWTD